MESDRARKHSATLAESFDTAVTVQRALPLHGYQAIPASGGM
jgi:hypothetical protein